MYSYVVVVVASVVALLLAMHSGWPALSLATAVQVEVDVVEVNDKLLMNEVTKQRWRVTKKSCTTSANVSGILLNSCINKLV